MRVHNKLAYRPDGRLKVRGASNLGVADSGGATAAHTYSGEGNASPYIIGAATWWNDTSSTERTLNTVTQAGVSRPILIQTSAGASGTSVGAALVFFDGNMEADNLVFNFSAAVALMNLRLIGLLRLFSSTPIDTDEVDINDGGGTTATLAALTAPGPGGIVLGAYINDDQLTAITHNFPVLLASGNFGINANGAVGYARHEEYTANFSCTGGDHNMAFVGASLR